MQISHEALTLYLSQPVDFVPTVLPASTITAIKLFTLNQQPDQTLSSWVFIYIYYDVLLLHNKNVFSMAGQKEMSISHNHSQQQGYFTLSWEIRTSATIKLAITVVVETAGCTSTALQDLHEARCLQALS